MKLQIRQAEISDAQGMLNVLNPIIEAGCYSILEETFSLDEQIQFIKAFPTRGSFYVAICQDSQELLGMQDVVPWGKEKTFAHVGEIATFVALHAHRKGVGQALMQKTQEVARQLGFHKLMATVRANNKQALQYYQQQGFNPIGIAKQHALIRGQWIDEVFLECLL